MSIQCERQPQCERQQQEYEFIMEGISTRMTMALDKMAESNKMMAASNRRLCVTMILVVIIVVLGFIADRQLLIRNGTTVGSSEVVTDAGADSSQRLSEPRPRTND